MVRRLRTRAILLVALVALLPLATLGALAIQRARSTLLEEASLSNADLAKRAATEIETHVEKYVDTLKHLSETLSPATGLSPQQAESVLHNYRRSVHDLRDLDYVGADGREIATGRVDGRTRDRSSDKAVRAALANELYRSPVFISEDLLPQMTIAVPQRSAGRVVGALVANVDLTEMWRVIDRIHVGARGYARVVGEDGTLLAVGDGKLKRLVFTREKDTSGPIVNQVLHGEKVPGTRYRGADGVEVLAVGQPIRSLGWALILEQPIDEALAPYYRFTSLILAISIVLLGLAALAGFLGAASVVRPIEVLRLRAGEIAQGLLEKRVEVRSPEELHALAEAMNQMCSDLIRLQDDVRKKERIATLGRLAAGLAHDLKHPVRALQMNARLILEKPDDPRVRQVFEQVVQREFKKLERFLDDLKRVSRDEPMDVVRKDIDVSTMVSDFAQELRNGGAPSGVEVVIEDQSPHSTVTGSRELLERVLSNLASNAFEAMEGEGTLKLRTSAKNGHVEVRVADTGCGIPPDRVAGLFNDFQTTKRRGLGLGLAVCKKIVADHGGEIAVSSEPGHGTEFCIRLPRAGGLS